MKKIQKPDIKDAVKISAFDLNKIHFSEKRTVLTSELLEKLGSGGDKVKNTLNFFSKIFVMPSLVILVF